MKKVLILAVIISAAFVSCSKDQKAVKRLDGSWSATTLTSTNSGITFDWLSDGATWNYTFNFCKLKTDDWCTATSVIKYPTTFGGLTETDEQYYRVTGDGTILETTDTIGGSISSTTIVDLTGSSLVLESVDGSTTTNATFSKN